MVKAIQQTDAIRREVFGTAEMVKAIQQTDAIRPVNHEVSKSNANSENPQSNVETNLTTPISDQDHKNKDSVSDEDRANSETQNI
jgi:hypothetical protein